MTDKNEKKPLPQSLNPTVVVFRPVDGAPAEPTWALHYDDAEKEERAHRYWAEICEALKDAGGLASSNGHAIFRLVITRIEFDYSARDVAERGVLRPATKKRFEHTNPHWRYMRQADETIRQLEAELGIAPVRRGRIGQVVRKLTRERPADRYLGKPANK